MEAIQSGKSCMFEVMAQDGPLCDKVCEVTSQLLALADRCFGAEGIAVLHKTLPSGTQTGNNIGRKVGGELHKILYDLALQARREGKLESSLKITRPTDRKIDPENTRKGERSAAGPDFVLSGIFNGEDVHAAWDFTTCRGLADHYDRDVLGKRTKRKWDPEEHPLDPEIQEVPDSTKFWTSYILIFY